MIRQFLALAVAAASTLALSASPPDSDMASPPDTATATSPQTSATDVTTGTDPLSATPSAAPDTLSDGSLKALRQPPRPSVSTELAGVDTLGVVPEELITTYEGGTRRIRIERTVFRRETPVEYHPHNRRDPFRALLVDEKKEGEIETDLLRLEGAILTGVVWSEGQYLAMVKDKDNRNFFLREGDPVYQGQVISVTQNNAVFEVSDFGDYQRITLKVKG